MHDFQRPIHSLPMGDKNQNAATLPDNESQQYAIPSFHGGVMHGNAEETVQSDEMTGQGQWSGSHQPRRSHRLQQQTEQDTWNNSQQTVHDANNVSAGHQMQMMYDANNASAGYHSVPYNNISNYTSNPYMANNEMMPPQNPINSAANFGWGAIYATPNNFHQTPTPTAPVMQPQWLQMQSAQQMRMPQPMLGGFGSGQWFFTKTNDMHQQQIRNMSTENSYSNPRRLYLDGLRKKIWGNLANKYKDDEFLEPVQWPLSTEDSDSNSLHPIDQIRRDMWLALPEKYKTDDLHKRFNSQRHYSIEDSGSSTIESISLQRETERLLLLVCEARVKEFNALPPASVYIRKVMAQIEQPMTPLPLPSYLEQAAKEPIDLHFMQPLLVILDLNGTLLYRRRKVFPPKFTRRPALNYFLERLTSRHIVMVWSSSRQDTVDAICEDIFSTVQKQKLAAKWSRNQLGLTPDQFNNKVQVYKELEKVWADPKIQANFPTKKDRAGKAALNAIRYAPGLDEQTEMTGFLNKRWDQSNTVLIDDSTLKAAANPYNILQVPEFTNVPNDNDTTVLKELLLKIRVLAKSNDVSRRLRALGPKGIQIRREDVLASASESEAEVESIKEQGKNGKEEGERVVGSTEVFETENQIVPISLPPQTKLGPKKEKAKAEKAKRKAMKREKKLKASLGAPSS